MTDAKIGEGVVRGYVYVKEVLKLLPEKLDPILSAPIFAKVANLDAIHILGILAAGDTPETISRCQLSVDIVI